ncbi:hypothetical protein PN498_01175 [Oscillatoria sp. CS-180]|uniref:hypothetical protein n=1 Tax=Oscillatoria sp. CS-180 TaxID=3021720 RepID=UPI00232BF61C|nr:hypothetical protein [Oscillatoria sp. CS-180]MDB9524585.1 hypothetical protein [Oscillatoria sp. CS-180]
MRISQILDILPAPLEWMVLFNLDTMQQITTVETVRAMYHLPADLDLTPYSHVVLTNIGRFLAEAAGTDLVEPIAGQRLSQATSETCLAQRFAEQLALFEVDTADCVGLGQIDAYNPVLLHIVVENGVGQAQAVFDQAPSTQHYELLQAVGVKFLGGTEQKDYYLAQFQNRLPVHIHAGILSHFSRTGHCNLFFLQHGNIDSPLEGGLLQAAQSRLRWGHQRSAATLAKLAQSACQQVMPMLCSPPLPDRPFLYGDLVPLGFVLRGLKVTLNAAERTPNPSLPDTAITEAVATLRTYLLEHQQEHLWAFHQGRLLTATDSALVLQGMEAAAMLPSLAALEAFASPTGGYVPQLWALERQGQHMAIDDSCRHWCQPDYGTTALISALRQQAGQSTDVLQNYLFQGMDNRSGLYFANPYLMDWILAQAIQEDPGAEPLRQQLWAEVRASMNEDYSFGQYDVAFSTALAIATLQLLGDRSRTMLAAQLRLLDFIEPDGRWPLAAPFYSSLRLDQNQSQNELVQQSWMNAFGARSIPGYPSQQPIRSIEGVGETQSHGISLYLDIHRMISTAMATIALAEPCLSEAEPFDQVDSAVGAGVHPRYQCRTHYSYIAKFALPPYVRSVGQNPIHSRIRPEATALKISPLSH